jgi:hypothetical protein
LIGWTKQEPMSFTVLRASTLIAVAWAANDEGIGVYYGEVCMAVAIGSNAAAGTTGYMSRVAPQAEVARYQKQLSDCVNCSSSKTLEGKAHIQELSSKISVDQQRIKQVESMDAAANDSAASSSTTTVAGDSYSNTGAAVPALNQAQGDLVNVFA